MPHIHFIGNNNVTMRGTEEEDKQFVFCPDEDVPFIADIAGTTPPNPKYFISRLSCDHYVLFHLTQGRGTLEYNGVRYSLKPQDTVILSPKSKHVYYPDPDDPFEIVWVNFFCDWMGDYLRFIGLEGPVVSGVDCAEHFRSILRRAKASPNNDYLCFPVLHTVQDILLSLAERLRFVKRETAESPLAVKIKNMLDDMIYKKADVGGIADKLFISRSSVYREFKQYFGEAPHQYVLDRKIELAKSLLYRTRYSIGDISEKLCFTDEFYFSTIFKKKTGLSPSAYRKQCDTSPPPFFPPVG